MGQITAKTEREGILDRYVRCEESLFSFVLVVCGSGGFEANRVDEIVESLDDSLVELVK